MARFNAMEVALIFQNETVDDFIGMTSSIQFMENVAERIGGEVVDGGLDRCVCVHVRVCARAYVCVRACIHTCLCVITFLK